MSMDSRAIAMGLAFSLMWSSAFATARVIVAYASPLASLSLRFLISGLIAVALASALGQSWRLTRAQARSVVVFGLCQNALYLGLNFVALQWVEASLASIIASSMPLIVALLGWLIWREKVSTLGVVGLLAGFSGVALIMGGRVSGGADPLAIAMCVAAATALAVATLTVRSATSGGNLLMIVGLQMLVGSVALGVISAFTETVFLRPSWPLALAFLYQIAIPGLTATLVWFTLVGRVGAVKASAFHFLNPFFGVMVAALLLGERIGILDMIGVAIAAAGILAVQLSRMKPST
jgi:probable blue pigment (indigoidine) exporter